MAKSYLSLLLLIFSSLFSSAQSVTVGVLGNTGENPGWYKLGTLLIPQHGQDVMMKIASGGGYNAALWQNGECFVHFRTSNGESADNGFLGAASYYTTGRSKIAHAMKIKQVTPEQFEFYALLPVYTGNGSPLIVESYSGTWQNQFVYTPVPPDGYNVQEEFFMLSSAYFNSNVGIGVSDTKGYRLAVGGSMIAESVKVKSVSAWPDYVFHPDYALPPLSEIEKFINDHQHLPDMPAAAEAEKDGVDLGEMNKMLLKKVEELTLYIIEQDKRIRQLEALNGKIK